jgi:hypothetical protein
MSKQIKSKYDSQDNPNYGGRIKPTTPDIKKKRPPTVMNEYQRDNARAEAKFGTRGAARPWKPKAPAAVSKGGCDVPGDVPSKRRNDPPGALKKGYTKR